DLRYVFDIQEDCHGKEATRRDRREVAAGRCSGLAGRTWWTQSASWGERGERAGEFGAEIGEFPRVDSSPPTSSHPSGAGSGGVGTGGRRSDFLRGGHRWEASPSRPYRSIYSLCSGKLPSLFERGR